MTGRNDYLLTRLIALLLVVSMGISCKDSSIKKATEIWSQEENLEHIDKVKRENEVWLQELTQSQVCSPKLLEVCMRLEEAFRTLNDVGARVTDDAQPDVSYKMDWDSMEVGDDFMTHGLCPDLALLVREVKATDSHCFDPEENQWLDRLYSALRNVDWSKYSLMEEVLFVLGLENEALWMLREKDDYEN